MNAVRTTDPLPTTTPNLLSAVNLRLALLGLPTLQGVHDAEEDLVAPLLERQRELSRRLDDRLPPVDERIEAFLADFLEGTDTQPRLPRRTLTLDLPGLARTLSLPVDADDYSSELLTSYRLANGVLHNPRNDRRTTAGVFHIAEGGLPIPADKKAVPREVFGHLLERALTPPAAALELPITSTQAQAASCFVSLLLRPLVVVGVPGRTRERRMETRFIVPGSMVGEPRLRRRHLRQRRRPLPPRERCRPRSPRVDRSHRLRHPRAPPHPRDQAVPRPPPSRQGDRAADP